MQVDQRHDRMVFTKKIQVFLQNLREVKKVVV